MPPKKRKVNFDIEELGRGYEQIQQWFSKLKSSLDDCCLSDAADILSPDNILSLSGLKFGFRFVENLMSILSVVPEEAGPDQVPVSTGRRIEKNSRRHINISRRRRQIQHVVILFILRRHTINTFHDVVL